MKSLILILVMTMSLLSCSDKNEENLKSSLVGTWELTAYQNIENDIILPPTDITPVKIVFNENRFEGNTGVNEFLGTYTISAKQLTLATFGITEIAETEWGEKFLNALNKTYVEGIYQMPFIIENQVLKIEYLPAQFMCFSKIN